MASHEYFKEVFDLLATDGAIGDPTGQPAYCYLRVSSSDQAEEGRSGLPRQLQHVHQVARDKGYRISWELVYADDHSGFEFKDRPALSKLREEYKRDVRRANAIVIEYLDRLSRNADWHQGFLLDEMKQHKLEVVFWKPFSSRIERAVMGAISQEGMEQAKERMMQGNIHKAESGRITARVPAYGYMFVDSEGRPASDPASNYKKDTHYTPREDEAEVVRLIYRKIGVEGHSLRSLCAYLDERYPPPKKYKHWLASQLRVIIRNELYKGEFYAHRWKHTKVPRKAERPGDPPKMVYKKIERPRDEWILVEVPPLVSPQLWQMANRVLDKNAQMSRRNAKEPFLLTGVVRCGGCGNTYTGSRKKKVKDDGTVWRWSYYRCSGRTTRTRTIIEEIGCSQGHISCRILDKAVWSAICEVLTNPELIVEQLESDYANGVNAQLMAEIAALERQVAEKDAEDEKLYRAYLADVFDEHEFSARRKAVKQSRTNLEAELQDLRGRVLTEEELEERKALIRGMADYAVKRGLTEDASFEFKQQIIKLVVDEIELNVNEDRFRIEGVVRGRHQLGDSIGYAPTDMDCARRSA